MPTITRSQVDDVLRKLERQGAKVERASNNARRLVMPNGKFVMVHDSPSTANWPDIIKRAVERNGLVWPLADGKAAKDAAKEFRRRLDDTIQDVPSDFTPPTGPIEDVMLPPGAKELGDKRPIDRHIALVRGALHSLGTPPTFWTAEVANLLSDQPGFKGSQANGVSQGVLHWLGYRVVEARKNRRGFIYRWALDPTENRVQKETLPIADLYPMTTAETPVEPEAAPAEPETPTPEPEAVSEAPVAAEEEVSLSDEVDYLKRRAEMNLEHYRRAKAERDEARREAEKLRGALAWAIRQRDDAQAAVEQLTQAEDGWDAIEFRPDRNWGEMQEWATSFGLDLVVKVKRA